MKWRRCFAMVMVVVALSSAWSGVKALEGGVKPTIVLVHGAFVDASSWQRVIAILQHDEYPVVAVQAPLTSLAADVEATRRLIHAQNGPVVLVGHSWGGAVITDAAAGDERVKALVYIAAFAPESKEVVTAFNDQYPTGLGAALKVDAAGYLSVDPAQFQTLFAKDLPALQARIGAATQKPMLGSAFGDVVGQAAWKSIPSWYVLTLADQAIQPQLQRFYANRMNAKITEINSSHMVIVSHAAKVAQVIEEAALGR